MARKPRIHFPGALYHVIARGNRRQKVFLRDTDYQIYLSFLKEYKERYGFYLYAYALMPNHIHLLIEVGETPLSRLMHTLQFRYTRNFNIKYKKRGHLFQGRYKAILCEKDAYLLELSAYIHLNPVRAGLANDPLHYQWSSYSTYMTKGNKQELVDKDFLLAQFSKKRKAATREYERFIKQRVDQGRRDDLYAVRDQRFLGEDEFIESIHRSTNEDVTFFYDISIAEIVSEVSSGLQIPATSIHSPSRIREGALGRAIVAYLARKLGGYQIKAVAEHFHRDPVVISQGVGKLEEKLKEERLFLQKVNRAEKSLTKGKERKYLVTYA